jgi:hypothetical protein
MGSAAGWDEMDSLLKRIKSKLSWQSVGHSDRRLVVAAFGKHPGWKDHMEDLGLETEVLVTLKRILYVQGITGNFKEWSDLEKKQASIEFGHTFVWCRDEDIVVGRLWKSRDGSHPPRTSYPMVVCAHGRRVPLRWVYDQVLTRLADLETKCRSCGSAAEVKACLSACQSEFSGLSDAPSGSEEEHPNGADAIARLAEYPELGPGQEGLVRILYHIDRAMQAGPLSPLDKGPCRHSAHARVPLSGAHVTEASIRWVQLLLGKYGQACGVSLFLPGNQAWLDLLVGEPDPPQLYCLRASLAALPLTTTVPYNVSPEFAEETRQRIAHSRAVL